MVYLTIATVVGLILVPVFNYRWTADTWRPATRPERLQRNFEGVKGVALGVFVSLYLVGAGSLLTDQQDFILPLAVVAAAALLIVIVYEFRLRKRLEGAKENFNPDSPDELNP